MLEYRFANSRGRADFGWLKSQHSFSFGRYYDPVQMGFSVLRVINDDWVAPGAGFEPHGHQNMEIISLVLDGAIAHQDSTGQQATLPAGEYQLMSAGSGIRHSEFNASDRAPLRFLQIWLEPRELHGPPGYQQMAAPAQSGLQRVASPDGQAGSLRIRQDATLYQLKLAAAQSVPLQVAAGRKLYIHVVHGHLQGHAGTDSTPATADVPNNAASFKLQAGDGVKISVLNEWQLSTDTDVFALVFDLP